MQESNGRTTLKWDDAESEPPSDLARSYMRFAANNPAHFFSRTVPQFLGDEDTMSEEDKVVDKKLLISIRSVLAKYTELASEAERATTKARKKSLAKEDDGTEGGNV